MGALLLSLLSRCIDYFHLVAAESDIGNPTQLDSDILAGAEAEPMVGADEPADAGAEAVDVEPSNQYEDDGFIVEDLSGGEEDQPSVQRSRLKKKREKKRKRVLEEEDYELMQENLGYKVPRPKLTKKDQAAAPVVEKAAQSAGEDAENKAEALGRLLFDGALC